MATKTLPHYNIAYLRGDVESTDEDVRETLLEIHPDLNIPEATMHTKAFVPTILGEMERKQRSELVGVVNPQTNKEMTDKDAAMEARRLAKSAYSDYKRLLKGRGIK